MWHTLLIPAQSQANLLAKSSASPATISRASSRAGRVTPSSKNKRQKKEGEKITLGKNRINKILKAGAIDV